MVRDGLRVELSVKQRRTEHSHGDSVMLEGAKFPDAGCFGPTIDG